MVLALNAGADTRLRVLHRFFQRLQHRHRSEHGLLSLLRPSRFEHAHEVPDSRQVGAGIHVDLHVETPLLGDDGDVERRPRADEVNDGGIQDKILANATDARDGFFTVPKVIE